MDEFEQHDHALAQTLTDKVLSSLDKPQGPDGKFMEKPEAPEEAAEVEESEPEGEEEGVTASEDTEPEEEDIAPEDTQPSDENEGDEPDIPTIDPPKFWTAEQREVWDSLTPEAQQVVLARETERDSFMARERSEAAEAKKAAQAEREATSQERQRYAEALKQLAQTSALDPVLQKGPEYWAQLAAAERNGEVEYGTYNAERAEYDQRMAMMGQLQHELKDLTEKQTEEAKAAYQSRLNEQFPEYVQKKDEFQREWEPVLQEVGFTREEIAQGWNVPHEPRYLKILDLASKGMKAERARKSIVEKKAGKPAAKVAKPKAPDDSPQVSKRVVALEKRAKETGRDADKVNAILARLEEHPT